MTETPEGRRSPPAGALESGSPLEAARDSNPGSAVPGRVVHCKREPYDVYIGRPGPFGNPFQMRQERDRAKVIEQFGRYARNKVAKAPDFARAVKGLHGKVLGCYCAPKACHGDVLLKLAAEQHDGDKHA